jgi:hypothetical protein
MSNDEQLSTLLLVHDKAAARKLPSSIGRADCQPTQHRALFQHYLIGLVTCCKNVISGSNSAKSIIPTKEVAS